MSSYSFGEPVPMILIDGGVTATLANYAEVVLTIVQPDGTTVTRTKTGGTLTTNPYIFTSTQTGRGVYYFVTTTPNGATTPQPFDVDAPAAAGVISLDDAKQHLNKSGTADDDELQEFIRAATDIIEGLIGPVSPATQTDAFVTDKNSPWPYHYGVWPRYTYGVRTVDLRKGPVRSVTSVTVSAMDGTSPTVLGASSYRVDLITGTISVIDGSVFGPLVTVVYNVGRSTVPPAVRMAAKILVEHLWETQRGSSSDLPTGLDMDTAGPTFGTSYVIPNRVREALEPYMPPPVIA